MSIVSKNRGSLQKYKEISRKNGKNNLGKKRTIEVRKRMSIAQQNRLIKYGTSHLARKKEKHWNWKGGITEEKVIIRKSSKYKLWRDHIFKRDGYRCTICNSDGFVVADHYPIPFHIIFKYNRAYLWDTSCGRTLCTECHKIETQRLKKYDYMEKN